MNKNRSRAATRWVWLFAVGLLPFVVGQQRAQEPFEARPSYPDRDFSNETAYPVVRVVDGDTIVVLKDGRKTKVRIYGVDTPETVHPKKKVEYYGKEASQFTRNLLQGESVYLQYEPGQSPQDHYGRTVAYVFRAPDGLFVDVEILRQGYGHHYTKKPSIHADLFRYYEQAARESRRGLWGDRPSAMGLVDDAR